MKTRKKYILVKMETTYGTDSTPAAINAILTSGLQRSLYEGNVISRDNDRATLGGEETVNTAPYAMLEFSVELAGAGAAGTAPAYGPLLRACGFAETINASTDVQYDPVSSAFESVSIYYDRDGERQILTGCRGSVEFTFSTGGYPMMNFRMVGLYNKPATATAVTPDVSGFQDPLPVNNRNTGTCTLDGFNLQLQSLSLNMAAETPHLDLVNFEQVLYVDRAPAGDLSFLAPTIATKDIMAMVESHLGTIDKNAFQIVHGSTAGNIVQLDAPKVQLSGLSEIDIQGEQGYQSNALFLPDSGDDEVKLTIK